MRNDDAIRVTHESGLEVLVYRSERDGRLVVQLDSEGLSGADIDDDEVPRVRVNVNDGLVFDATVETGS